jgi:hypothetical protein
LLKTYEDEIFKRDSDVMAKNSALMLQTKKIDEIRRIQAKQQNSRKESENETVKN